LAEVVLLTPLAFFSNAVSATFMSARLQARPRRKVSVVGSVSPLRKRQHHQKACHDKSENNGKTIEFGEGDDMGHFQAQQDKGKAKTDTPSNK
jgi:hypothetical protein